MTHTDLFLIKEGNIFLPATKWYEEREIAEVQDNNAQQMIDTLSEKFAELVKEVEELKKEFDLSEEKIKMAGKVVRRKMHLITAKAIGDFQPLLTQLESMEELIKAAIDANLTSKEKICVEAEQLLETNEWKNATEKLRDLQKLFKELPSVPDLRNDEFRERFEKTKDEFFKRKQANFEHFEQDLLDNLSKKLDLCERAEALQNSKDWKKTTDIYQELNEEWKKVGMVPKHRMEELWFRFNTAKDIFFNNKREHFGEIKTEQEGNLQLKLALIEKANLLKESTEWKKTSEAFNALMEEWKKIGRVAHDKSDEVWNQFLEIKNHFYQNKDAHYNKIRVQLDDNFARKMAIVAHAEELQNTSDFEMGTQEFHNMFEEWKTIGRVAKEHGDEAWERFLKAKKNFFDRKDANREKRKIELSKDLNEKVSRNRSNYFKVCKELQREEELLFDVEDRIKNLPATLRSYEKREEYTEMMDDIKEKINSLKAKAKEMKDKLNQDERELNYIMRGPRKTE
nr:DUF349 domain-containing protein [Chitinophagaceae bacterium]